MRFEKNIKLEKNNIFEKLEFKNGKQCHDMFGLNEFDAETLTIHFENGYFADLKMCVCDSEYECFSECVLFNNLGGQVLVTEPSESIVGEWELEYNGDTYYINVESGVI